MKKVALCFIISYDHILNKEEIWREWIQANVQMINIYFYYKDKKKIQSSWILNHTIPSNYIHETSYFHVIPAYLSTMAYAMTHDQNNTWFCMLTDSCCPIISPIRFRYMFETFGNQSILSWRKAWWNIDFHKRANLRFLPEELRLANDPWFVLKREHVYCVMDYYRKKESVVKTICEGGLANESLFAIALYAQNVLSLDKKKATVFSTPSHLTDWSRMTSSTSPHVFKEANETDISFIETNLKRENNKLMFIRKIHADFPDNILKHYIYEFFKEEDYCLLYEMRVNRIKQLLFKTVMMVFVIFCIQTIFMK